MSLVQSAAATREQRLIAAATVIRRKAPGMSERSYEVIAEAVLNAVEEVEDPVLRWAADVLAAVDRFVCALEEDANEDSFGARKARRELQERFRGENRSHTWELTNDRGEVIGRISGTLEDYERAQAALNGPAGLGLNAAVKS